MSVAYPSEEWFALACAAMADQGLRHPGLDARIQYVAGPHRWVEVIAGGRITEWRLGTLDDPDIEVRFPLETALGGLTGTISGTGALSEATVRDPSRTPDVVAPSPMDLGDQPELTDLPTIPGASVEVQYEYQNGPWGPVSFGLSFADGQVAGMRLGRLDAADVTVSCSFIQMARVRRGDIAILDVLAEGGNVAGEEGALALLGGISESPEFRRAEMACGRSGLALGVLGEVHGDPTHAAVLADLVAMTVAADPGEPPP